MRPLPIEDAQIDRAAQHQSHMVLVACVAIDPRLFMHASGVAGQRHGFTQWLERLPDAGPAGAPARGMQNHVRVVAGASCVRGDQFSLGKTKLLGNIPMARSAAAPPCAESVPIVWTESCMEIPCALGGGYGVTASSAAAVVWPGLRR